MAPISTSNATTSFRPIIGTSAKKSGRPISRAASKRRSPAIALTGNVGVQFVHSDQTVSGNAQSGNWPTYTFTPFAVDKQYWDVLPSLNLTWQIADDQQIRLGAGRSLARPRFDSMGGNTSVNFDATKATSTSSGRFAVERLYRQPDA